MKVHATCHPLSFSNLAPKVQGGFFSLLFFVLFEFCVLSLMGIDVRFPWNGAEFPPFKLFGDEEFWVKGNLFILEFKIWKLSENTFQILNHFSSCMVMF